MRSRRFCFLLVFSLFCFRPFAGQDKNKISNQSPGIVQVTSGRIFLGRSKFGTGLCLDVPCLHVLTNYHVSQYIGSGIKVEGEKVSNVQVVSGRNDDNAVDVVNVSDTASFKFNPDQDLSLLTLEEPLKNIFSKPVFATYQPKIGQEVSTIARHENETDRQTGRIINVKISAKYSSHQATLSQLDHLLVSSPARGGNSGGIVYDADGLIIGIIYAQAKEISPDSKGKMIGALALPIINVSRFLKKENSALWAQLFCNGSECFDEEILKKDKNEVLKSSIAPVIPLPSPIEIEPEEIRLDLSENLDPETYGLISKLKQNTEQHLSKMNNIFAEQYLEMWGDGKPKEIWRHEVAIFDGKQVFKEINVDGSFGEESTQLPFPKEGIIPGDQWSALFRDILSSGVRINYQARNVFGNKTSYTFNYRASSQDGMCLFRERIGKKENSWEGYVACSAQIITDQELNVIEITQELFPAKSRIVSFEKTTVRYGWVYFKENEHPLWLPLDIRVDARFNNGRKYYAYGVWKNYHRFESSSHIIKWVQ